MTDTHLANAPEARSPTGEIVNQAAPTTPVEPTVPLTSESTTPSTEAKPDASAPAAAKPEGDKSLLNKTEEAGKVPEKYDFKVPDGFVMDEAVSKEATELFKGLKLDQPSAQKLVDFYTAKTQEAAEAPYKAYTEMRQDWQAKLTADPEIGNKLTEVKQTFSRALDSLNDPALVQQFRELMDTTGAGDHPAFAKVLYRFAQRLTEGRPVAAAGPSAQGQRPPNAPPPTAAKALYPNLP